jgi:hypothetical protein
MNESRRNFAKGLGLLGAAPFLFGGGDEVAAAAAERKPLTKAGLVRSLLALAERAARDGFQAEAKAIMKLVGDLLIGTN